MKHKLSFFILKPATFFAFLHHFHGRQLWISNSSFISSVHLLLPPSFHHHYIHYVLFLHQSVWADDFPISVAHNRQLLYPSLPPDDHSSFLLWMAGDHVVHVLDPGLMKQLPSWIEGSLLRERVWGFPFKLLTSTSAYVPLAKANLMAILWPKGGKYSPICRPGRRENSLVSSPHDYCHL